MTGTAVLVPLERRAHGHRLPIFYDNRELSVLANMLFPDDRELARKCVARMLLCEGSMQAALEAGCRFDNRYLTAILNDVRGGDPDPRLVAKRLRWARRCGRVVVLLFALVNSNDPTVRERASWEEAIRLAESEIGRAVRRNRSSFHFHLRQSQPVLHICGAFALASEGPRHPLTADALFMNAMLIEQTLRAWHARRQFPGSRNGYLDHDMLGRWDGLTYDDSHGVPDIGLLWENLIPRGKPGRPRKT